MYYGNFIDGGKAYEIHTPFTPVSWSNKLFNDSFQAEISQRMEGKTITVGENFAPAPFLGADIRFYMNYNKRPYFLCRNSGNSFKCVQRLYQSEVFESFDGLDFSLRVFVPPKGQKIIWTASFTNTLDNVAEVSFFSFFRFLNNGYMSTLSKKDSKENFMYYTGFPYYVKYDEMEKQKEKVNYKYVISDVNIAAFEGNAQRFYGCDDFSLMPFGVKENKLSNGCCQQEDCASIIQHRLVIKSSETKSVNLICGLAKEYNDIIKEKSTFLKIEAELEEQKQIWDDRCKRFIIKTQDTDFDNIVNYWLKKQLTYFVRLNRGNVYCPKRNQLQDLLGYSLIEPQKAFEYLVRIIKTQKHNGYIKQYYTTDGSPEKQLAFLNHSDAYVWFIICAVEVIEHNQNGDLYNFLIEYSDSPVKESVYQHLKKAALYMLTQLGEHGLCLMLDGDWNDPVNGPGHLGKGESCWNSMALVYALNKLNSVIFDPLLDNAAKELKDNINKYCWDGEWYIAGINDDGVPYGSSNDEEAKKFLNTQTWSIFSGVCEGDRLSKVVKTIESMKNDYGYVLLDPPFSKYNPVWGRVSLKTIGTTENGSVYNHAVMFKAFADFARGDSDAAIETNLRTLPTNYDSFPENSQQYPLFYSNYYFGYKNENLGRSSYHYRTGTVAWLLWIVYQHIFGINIASDRINIEPALPSRWKKAAITSRVGDDIYVVEKSGQDVKTTKNGKTI